MSVKQIAADMIAAYGRRDRNSFKTLMVEPLLAVTNAFTALVQATIQLHIRPGNYYPRGGKDINANPEVLKTTVTFNTAFAVWKALHNRVCARNATIAADREYAFNADTPLDIALLFILKELGYDKATGRFHSGKYSVQEIDAYLQVLMECLQRVHVSNSELAKLLFKIQHEHHTRASVSSFWKNAVDNILSNITAAELEGTSDHD